MASVFILSVFLATISTVAHAQEASSYPVGDPLYLTPFIKAKNLEAGRRAARVVDPCDINNVTEDCGTKIPDSYAGFLTVHETLGNHLFFWYLPSQKKSAPLLIWLNGGPGQSSMKGLLFGNGPIQPRSLDDTNPTGKFEKRERSWLESFSMLYIDNPVHVGSSHSSSGYRTEKEEYGTDLFECVQQFYQLFPDLLSKDLYIGGVSYAGKYVSILAHKIHVAREDKTTQIPLKGIYLFSPFFFPEVQLPEAFNTYYEFGILNELEAEDSMYNLTQFIRLLKNGQMDSKKTLNKSLELVFSNGQLYQPNYITGRLYPDNVIDSIMQSDRIRSAIHVGNCTFMAHNNDLMYAHDSDFFSDTTEEMSTLLNSGSYKILIASGDYDLLTSVSSVEKALLALPCWKRQRAYKEAARRRWEMSSASRTPYGYYTHMDNLCRVIVHGAGHHIYADNPKSCTKLITQFVETGCVSSESETGVSNVGTNDDKNGTNDNTSGTNDIKINGENGNCDGTDCSVSGTENNNKQQTATSAEPRPTELTLELTLIVV